MHSALVSTIYCAYSKPKGIWKLKKILVLKVMFGGAETWGFYAFPFLYCQCNRVAGQAKKVDLFCYITLIGGPCKHNQIPIIVTLIIILPEKNTQNTHLSCFPYCQPLQKWRGTASQDPAKPDTFGSVHFLVSWHSLLFLPLAPILLTQ